MPRIIDRLGKELKQRVAEVVGFVESGHNGKNSFYLKVRDRYGKIYYVLAKKRVKWFRYFLEKKRS
jgi:hypothetical protein